MNDTRDIKHIAFTPDQIKLFEDYADHVGIGPRGVAAAIRVLAIAGARQYFKDLAEETKNG